MAYKLMVQGTMSGAGKSLITAGLLRIFHKDGYKAAPFKSQNMALNSYITDEGLEIGRAQAMQAMAAGTGPLSYMNPILLKPNSDMGSQVIVGGKPIGNMHARDYFAYKKKLIPDIMSALHRLEEEYDVIIIEGAGSPAEINLKSDDIVNMGMAKLADAPVILVGDIDRGGVFAQLYGTTELLEPEEKARIKGLVINKFRGDVSLLDSGISQIEKLTGIDVLGTVPYVRLDIEEEDSQSDKLNMRQDKDGTPLVRIIRLPHISNYTDFDPLMREETLSVAYVDRIDELSAPDLVIIPGTKNTMSDLEWLRKRGLDRCIRDLAGRGVPVIGICGGYQILGQRIEDPCGVEHGGVMDGLGLINMVTYLMDTKVTCKVRGRAAQPEGFYSFAGGLELSGYEIHMGRTSGDEAPFALIRDEGSDEMGAYREDGAVRGSVLGSYMHGLFDSDEFRRKLIEALYDRGGYEMKDDFGLSQKAYREREYDKLEEALRAHLDMDRIRAIMGMPNG